MQPEMKIRYGKHHDTVAFCQTIIIVFYLLKNISYCNNGHPLCFYLSLFFFLLFILVVFFLARGSMEAHAHAGWKVFKYGTLIGDNSLTRFTKFHVCT